MSYELDHLHTFYRTIKEECDQYSEQFKGKIIYCNTDAPRVKNNAYGSNFYTYFKRNFKRFQLKGLIATKKSKRAKLYFYNGEKTYVKPLKGNGDFRSKECISLLKQADIVVTHPPSRLFKSFIYLMMKYEKSFLVIAPFQKVTDDAIFPLIKHNKLWLGYAPKGMLFFTPKRDYKKVSTCWFTNLNVSYRNEKLHLTKTYYKDANKYTYLDNYRALYVSRVSHIPKDYKNAIAVPITFLNKYSPKQFKILDARAFKNTKTTAKTMLIKDGYIDGVKKPTRMLIKFNRESDT